MEKEESPPSVYVMVSVLFILLTALFVITAFSGTAWIIIELPTFSFWLTILTIGLAISARPIHYQTIDESLWS